MTKPRDPVQKPISPAIPSIDIWEDLPADLAQSCAESVDGPPQPPQGAALGPVSRRGFLRGAAVGAAAALAACKQRPVKHAMPFLIPPEEITPGVAVHYASTCGACSAACGLMVTVRDGRPVKLEGRTDHRGSQGGLCAFGQATIRGLYEPGRLQKPRVEGKDSDWTVLDGRVSEGLAKLKREGKPVHVLTHTLNRPTARQALLDFLKPYNGELFEYDPRTQGAALEAAAQLDGKRQLPGLDLTQADMLVSFGADLLGTGLDPVGHTRDWAGRRGVRDKGPQFHHLQVEGSFSLTGAAADERWQVTAAGQRLAALWLLRLVAESVGGAEGNAISTQLETLPAPPVDKDKLRHAAARLTGAKGRSLVVSGSDDLVEQLAVSLINRQLGNDGKTVLPAKAGFQARGSDSRLLSLQQDLAAGKVGGLILLECDPVDELPGGADWAKQLAGLGLAVAISVRPTATAKACKLVAAAHHALERWDDFNPREGLVSLAQPAIRPLFKTRHPMESVLRWSGQKSPDYRAELKKAWTQKMLPNLSSSQRDPEGFWINAVKKGGAAGQVPYGLAAPTEAPEVKAGSVVLAAAITAAGDLAAKGDGLEVELIAEVSGRDGQQGNLPWLLELADPLTRVAWTACIRLAPARARALGVREGALVQVAVGKDQITLPVSILPGQHPQVVGVPVGYSDPERAGTNGFKLGQWDGSNRRRAGLKATLTAAGGSKTLPLMQWEGRLHHRPIVHQVATPNTAPPKPHIPKAAIWPEREQIKPSWEMAIDLDRCTGCSSCVVACQAENNIPVVGAKGITKHRDMSWVRIDRYFIGSDEDPQVLFEPMMCSQCDRAPCETVCPVSATVHSVDGLNQQVYNRCVGTRYCANNCPYKVRRFNWFDYTAKDPVERLVLNPDVVVRERGVMEKCTFCVQRIQAARIEARGAGDKGTPTVRTACQQTCPADAIRFGDGNDPKSEVSLWKKQARAFQVLPEVGTRPSITYLARVRPDSTEGGKKS